MRLGRTGHHCPARLEAAARDIAEQPLERATDRGLGSAGHDRAGEHTGMADLRAVGDTGIRSANRPYSAVCLSVCPNLKILQIHRK